MANDAGVTVAFEPIIQVDADVAAPPPPPVSPTSEPVVDHVMEDAEDDKSLADRLVRKKRVRTYAKVGGSGVAAAGEKTNPSSPVPLNVIPLVIVYPISDDEMEVVEQRTSSRRNSKSKKAKEVVQNDDDTAILFLYLGLRSIYATKS